MNIAPGGSGHILIGDDEAQFALPECRFLGELRPMETEELTSPEQAVFEGLARPIGLRGGLLDTVSGHHRVCIVIPDHTRHAGEQHLLPPLIAGLESRGVPDARIALLIGCGTHRPSRPGEIAAKIGPELYRRLSASGSIHQHNCDDTAAIVQIGVTSRGTPVQFHRLAVEADRTILLGGIVPHYFAGFGGGRKTALPGISSRETIARNHSLNLDPDADRINPAVQIGALAGNPVAEDMAEAARQLRPLGIVNSVMNRRRRIAAVFAGDVDEAFAAGCAFAGRQFFVELPAKADLVIGGAGPALDWVQSHKCLYNTHRALKDNGVKLIVANCPEGIGSAVFEEWLSLRDPARVLARLRTDAEINGQTAYSTLTRGRDTVLVTQLPPDRVALLNMIPAANLEQGMAIAMDLLRQRGIKRPDLLLLPDARYTVPMPAECRVIW